MNRAHRVVFFVAMPAIFLFFLFLGVGRAQAQEQTPTPAPSPSPQAAEDEENPFAPEPPPTLPPGMKGADVNDPRAKLSPGLYNAGETAMGMKHLVLRKKPSAFQLGATDPDDPKVQKLLGQLGPRNTAKMPKPMRLVFAQLAFANSDLAFQGKHLFQGNFYGVGIYDISNPAKTKLVTTFISTCQAHRMCGSRKNWLDAQGKSRIKIRIQRCSAST